MANYTDKQILEAIRNGDNRDILKYLYLHLLPNIERHICRNSGSKEEAFDVFQEAILLLYKQIRNNTFDENKYKITAYLYTICKNLWINWAKRKNLERKWGEQQIQKVEFETNIEQNLISEERKTILDKLFNQMGEECKKILRYSIYLDLSSKEIAVKLKSNENSIRVQSYRCRKKLREMVQGNIFLTNVLGN
jgi:RNA polymerase sigma factor (sigma-70 family)